jgi:hypothetical protein
MWTTVGPTCHPSPSSLSTFFLLSSILSVVGHPRDSSSDGAQSRAPDPDPAIRRPSSRDRICRWRRRHDGFQRCVCGLWSGRRRALIHDAITNFGGRRNKGAGRAPLHRARRRRRRTLGTASGASQRARATLSPSPTQPPLRAPDTHRARSDALLVLRHRFPPNRAGQMVVVPCSGGRRAWRSRGRRGASRCEHRSCSRCTKTEARRLEWGGRLAQGKRRGMQTTGAGVGRRHEEEGRAWREEQRDETGGSHYHVEST